MAGPLGVLPVGPAVATTEGGEDINGGPPGGCCRPVLQRPSPKLEKMSLVGPLGGAVDESDGDNYRS
jgi:hypothetical protein